MDSATIFPFGGPSAPGRLLLMQCAIAAERRWQFCFCRTAIRTKKPVVQRAVCCRYQDEFTRRLRRGEQAMGECRILSLIGVLIQLVYKSRESGIL